MPFNRVNLIQVSRLTPAAFIFQECSVWMRSPKVPPVKSFAMSARHGESRFRGHWPLMPHMLVADDSGIVGMEVIVRFL